MIIKKPIKSNTELQIKSNNAFLKFSKYTYPQLEVLNITDVILTFDEFINFFNKFNIDTIKNMGCNFKCKNQLEIFLYKYHCDTIHTKKNIYMDISHINKKNSCVLNNLPHFVDVLILEYPIIDNNDFYMNEFYMNDFYMNDVLKNLPITLSELIINLPYCTSNFNIIEYEKEGYLNFLFEIKQPYQCEVKIIENGINYQVTYTNNDDEIILNELLTSNKIVIKKIEILPKKVGLDVENVYLTSDERQRFAQMYYNDLIAQI